ncbi:uncharacterized protein FOBCDRAFT_253954 [Fusarium oxysporum Fo47]|uniref:uncharacterized protein n=1 Tax=Fusarium oxysporum Fo47 TaxID=660027 RepID=UPI00286990AE|nr:uncharacterized protein FOBCDRAFT_253954 [Fusarium oxysporum Fo47]QKD61529.2 hypothetical protein FOBCDRAFT_253954 [Fusarium oxysporum Fo47]
MSSKCVDHMRPKKPARRSRYGCRNCKLRKLKCDESKPRCKKCSSFGVLCNFGLNIPDLHPITSDTVRAVVRCKPTPQRPVASAIWTSDEYTIYQLNAKCQDFVTRYYARSLLTPDDENMINVNRSLFKLAFTNPCLMHASLAVALTYDRYLNTSSSSPRSLEECYHWSQSTALFNKKLREPVKTQDKDPIWGTAAALAVLTFSSPDAYRPEDSWPLKTGDDHLDWVSMISGKMSLWNMVDPLRNDSLFRVMAVTIAQMQAPLPDVGVEGIPEALASICQLNQTSTSESPYFYAAHAVSQILYLPDSEVTTDEVSVGWFGRCSATRQGTGRPIEWTWTCVEAEDLRRERLRRPRSVTRNTQGRDHAFLTLTAAAVLQSCSLHVLWIGRGAQCVVVSLEIGHVGSKAWSGRAELRCAVSNDGEVRNCSGSAMFIVPVASSRAA